MGTHGSEAGHRESEPLFCLGIDGAAGWDGLGDLGGTLRACPSRPHSVPLAASLRVAG